MFFLVSKQLLVLFYALPEAMIIFSRKKTYHWKANSPKLPRIIFDCFRQLRNNDCFILKFHL